MFELLKDIGGLLRGLSYADVARLSAYLLAPALTLGFTASSIYSPGLAIDLGRPLTVTELRTEISRTGEATARPGVAMIVEPIASEVHVRLDVAIPKIWSSLTLDAAQANRDRLRLADGGLTTKTPFLGVTAPVTIVVEGDLGTDLYVPGAAHRIDDWRLPSRRSLSILSSVMLACVFAFGMSLTIGLPNARRQ